jgi:hypothetical protein
MINISGILPAGLIFTLAILLSLNGYSQGCSDAGFCTMGAMRPNQHYAKKSNLRLKSIEGGTYLGFTEFRDILFSALLDFNFAITPRTAFQIKLPYNYIYGPLGSNQGLGDISLSSTRNLINREKYQINFTAGGKIPTGVPNAKSEDGRPLPMYYQTTLGTYDIVFGLSLISKNWLFATGYQQALNQVENRFTWGAWNGSPLREVAGHYPLSNQLKRGNDVMFRVERNFRSSRFNTYIGLLGIYRVKKDEITSPQTKQRVEVQKSDGLALTALYGFGYRFSVKTAVKFLIGASLIKRNHGKGNPDGLSRQLVNTLSFEYRF